MTTTQSRFFDELAKLMSNAAGAAQGVRREAETMVKAQIERMLRDMDVATREEVEVLRDLVASLRAQNDALAARVAALEAKLKLMSEAGLDDVTRKERFHQIEQELRDATRMCDDDREFLRHSNVGGEMMSAEAQGRVREFLAAERAAGTYQPHLSSWNTHDAEFSRRAGRAGHEKFRHDQQPSCHGHAVFLPNSRRILHCVVRIETKELGKNCLVRVAP